MSPCQPHHGFFTITIIVHCQFNDKCILGISGVEALGLLLGIFQLLISAIEHYDDVLRPIHRYRQFSSRSQRFCDELETERIVFQAECQLLLGEFVGLGTAGEMLCDPSHPSWRDENLCTKFESRLGTLGATCLSTISKIKNKLDQVNETFKPHP